MFEFDRRSLADMRGLQDAAFAQLAPPLSDAVERTDHVVSDRSARRRARPPPADAARARPRASTRSTVAATSSGRTSWTTSLFDRYCSEFGCVGVSVEYRLAPETPYPGPLDDCWAGLVWTFAHADELGIDPARDRDHGHQRGRRPRRGTRPPRARPRRRADRVPAAAVPDDRRPPGRRRRAGTTTCIIWSREANTFGWRCYLGAALRHRRRARVRGRGARRRPGGPSADDGHHGRRRRLPRREHRYASRLGQAGVPTDLCVIAGAPHGVQLFAGTRPERRWARAVEEWLRPRLEPPAS